MIREHSHQRIRVQFLTLKTKHLIGVFLPATTITFCKNITLSEIITTSGNTVSTATVVTQSVVGTATASSTDTTTTVVPSRKMSFAASQQHRQCLTTTTHRLVSPVGVKPADRIHSWFTSTHCLCWADRSGNHGDVNPITKIRSWKSEGIENRQHLYDRLFSKNTVSLTNRSINP